MARVGAEDGVGLWLMLIYGWACDLGLMERMTSRRCWLFHDFNGWDGLAPLHACCDVLSVLAFLARLEAHLLQFSLQEILSHIFESVSLLQELSCLEDVVARVLSSQEGQ